MNYIKMPSSLDSSNVARLSEMLRKKAFEKNVAQSSTESSNKSFVEAITDSATKINEYQKDADKQMKDLSLGNSKNIIKTMMAIERADVSFKFATQVRNKSVDAYKELMRMPG